MSLNPELVVLLDDAGNRTGVADKATIHTADTPLHWAFSCHVFNAAGEVLVTRRALTKRTWPGVWTGSFCGHPAPDELAATAVARRAKHELGLDLDRLTLVDPEFRYRAVDASGIVENELCPVYTATTADDVVARRDEVGQFEWVNLVDLGVAVTTAPWAFSPWLTLQIPLLLEPTSSAAEAPDAPDSSTPTSEQ